MTPINPNRLRPHFVTIAGEPGEQYDIETWRLMWWAYLQGYKTKRLTRLELLRLLVAGAIVERSIEDEITK